MYFDKTQSPEVKQHKKLRVRGSCLIWDQNSLKYISYALESDNLIIIYSWKKIKNLIW